jgi:hypothetical protein
MTITTRLIVRTGVLAATFASAHAQPWRRTAFGNGARAAQLPPPERRAASRFMTAEEHYAYLLDKRHGGTKHTMAPSWCGTGRGRWQ